jgi:fructose-bisphosphate aldolase, class I
MNAIGVESATTSTSGPAWEGAVEKVSIPSDGIELPAELVVPPGAQGLVRFTIATGGILEAPRATEHLDALNRIDRIPWQMSFSHGRALQAPALKAWSGQEKNAAAAPAALLHRARCNSAARCGQYSFDMEARAA